MLRRLYHGRTPAAFRFQMAVIVIDLAIIAFFIARRCSPETRSFLWIDYSVAALVAADMIARLLASTDMLRLLKQPASWVDVFILADAAFPADARQSRLPAHPAALVAVAQQRAVAAARRSAACAPGASRSRRRQPADLPLRHHRLRLHLLLLAPAPASKAMSTRSISPSRPSPRPASATSCCRGSPAS